LKVEGQHVVEAPRQRVWELLNDPQVLQRATPGVKELHPLGNDVYRAVIELQVGPVKGNFEGKISITNKTPPERMTMTVEGSGRPGTVRATGELRLESQDSRTLVHYTGDVQATGTLMSIGHRLFGGVAKQMAAQFFTSLQRELEKAAKT
jgi:carbon monoxide dehydrogenase subunit G